MSSSGRHTDTLHTDEAPGARRLRHRARAAARGLRARRPAAACARAGAEHARGAGERGPARAALGEVEGTGTSGEDLLPSASLPFEMPQHRRAPLARRTARPRVRAGPAPAARSMVSSAEAPVAVVCAAWLVCLTRGSQPDAGGSGAR